MDNNNNSEQDELRCEEKCIYEWVECMEKQDGAAICKTLERNCFGECTW